MKPENVLMCVDETHVRHLAQEAVEWQRLGLKPSGSAVATVTGMENGGGGVGGGHSNAPLDPEIGPGKITRNKKKKLRKKQKRIQTLIDMQQKQIELLEKENLNLLGYDTTVVTPNSQLDAAVGVDITQCTQPENKRLSKLISIVQDVNIDTVINSSSSLKNSQSVGANLNKAAFQPLEKSQSVVSSATVAAAQTKSNTGTSVSNSSSTINGNGANLQQPNKESKSKKNRRRRKKKAQAQAASQVGQTTVSNGENTPKAAETQPSNESADKIDVAQQVYKIKTRYRVVLN